MGISLSGVGSGFDWQSLITQLTQAETQQKIDPLKTQKTQYQSKLTAWQSLGSKLAALKTATENLKDSSDFDVFTASLSSSTSKSAESLLTATTTTGVTGGRYEIIIDHVAKAQKIQSATVVSQSTDAGWTGSLTLEGHTLSLDGKSIQTLRNEINDLNSGDTPSGVTATILQVTDNDFRLILTHDTTGAQGMIFADVSDGHYFSTGTPETGYSLNTLQAGADAEFSIDGIAMTRSSNSVTDAIPNVTLDLKSEDASTTVTVDVIEDTEAITSKIQTFVNAYNDVLTYISQQMSYNTTSSTKGGALFGDNTLKSIKSNLQNTLLGAGLFNGGVTVDNSNKLSFDTDDFKAALADDFEGTTSLFNDVAQSLNSILDNLTDDIDGTVTLQESSLTSGMARLDTRITTTQALIDRRMEMLTKQYSALDSALTQMQSQQEWLSTQLASLSSSQ